MSRLGYLVEKMDLSKYTLRWLISENSRNQKKSNMESIIRRQNNHHIMVSNALLTWISSTNYWCDLFPIIMNHFCFAKKTRFSHEMSSFERKLVLHRFDFYHMKTWNPNTPREIRIESSWWWFKEIISIRLKWSSSEFIDESMATQVKGKIKAEAWVRAKKNRKLIHWNHFRFCKTLLDNFKRDQQNVHNSAYKQQQQLYGGKYSNRHTATWREIWLPCVFGTQ